MNRYWVAWILCSILAAWLAQPVTGQEKVPARRTWKDTTGKYTVEAELVESKDGIVRMRKQSGEVVSVPLDRLSLADQKYVERMLAARDDAPDGAQRTINCRLRYLTMSPDGSTLASEGTSPDDQWKNELKLWSAATGRPVATLEDYFGFIGEWEQADVAFTSDARMIVGGKRGPADPTGILGHRRIPGYWDAKTGRTLQIDTPRLSVTEPPSPAEKRFWLFDSESHQIRRPEIVSGGFDAAGFVIHVFSLEKLRHGTTLSPDGKTYALVNSQTVVVGDLGTRPRATLNTAGRIGTLSFSPDGESLVIACHEKVIEVWDVRTGRKRYAMEYDYSFRHHTPYDGIIQISPDGKTLVSFGGGKTELWDLETGRQRGTISGLPRVRCLALSADSTILALGCEPELDCPIRLFHAKTADALASLKGHTAAVRAVFFLPDRKTLISGSEDGTIRWWDITAIKDMLREDAGIP